MRTIIENREDMATNYAKDDMGYSGNVQSLIDSRSCFYNFGETQSAQFIASPNEKRCQYIQKFIDEILKSK